jgi:type I restriction enzyme S subunit
LEYDQFKGLELPLPDYETQERIANYLDEETALIDDLIAKQQRLLALLEEKRRATITHAVTRGLNPSVDLKETNIPWLGQIPVHWKLKKARYLFDRIKDVPRNGDDVVTAFRDGEVVLRSLRRTEGFTFADKEIGYQHVSKGDLVIHAMDGFAGAIGVSKSHGKMSPVCSICRPKDESKINTEYFAQLVRTMAKSDWLTAIAKGIRERSTDFRWADFANMEFPLPPPEEQSAIINSIQDEELKLATLKNKINVQISFLKERRTSLISHAVTGKIKV